MNNTIITLGVFLIALFILAIPLGKYISQVMNGEIPKYVKFLKPIENFIYRIMGKNATVDMTSKKYAFSVIIFSVFSFILLLLILVFQNILPLNGENVEGMSIPLAINTAVSYITNTNWQAYAGEESLSLFSQIFGLTVQNFISAGVGISVLCVLVRGFIQNKEKTLGNFWKDLTRSIIYILIPISIIVSVILISQGVVQTFKTGVDFTGLNGKSLWVSLGTVASQVAIKQLGTNGGGFFGANSAHPLENPTVISNFVENLSILIIPVALIIAFGIWVKNWKEGRTILIVSLIFFIVGFVIVALFEKNDSIVPELLSKGNMEGKEVRFGTDWSSLWAVSTTAASNGSVNSMLDSFTSIGGLIPMFLMQLGEIIFGGAGSGLYAMITFILLTVFISGLLVGRTPEFLGKKVEPFEMKMVSIVILTPLLLTIFGAVLMVINPNILDWITNNGPQGFSEILYGATSIANNNGSAFAGLEVNTTFLNLLGSLMMLLSRFLPMMAIIFLGGSFSKKRFSAVSEGTLSTTSSTFVIMLVLVILIIGALTFLPAMALGPIAEFFQN